MLPLQYQSSSLFTWSGVLGVPPWCLQGVMLPRGTQGDAQPQSQAHNPLAYGVGCTF